MTGKEVCEKLGEVVQRILLGNREVSIRHDTDKREWVFTLKGFNKAQNVVVQQRYRIPEQEVQRGSIAFILEKLNQNIEAA